MYVGCPCINVTHDVIGQNIAQRPVSQKILSPPVILSMEKTMVAMVINELKSISKLKDFSRNWTQVTKVN